ncbi:hypothetical protein TNCV_236731 [Trichonephila clavipes]|nr:hypothetical protein TNCV_236731 [Trichonephila clavipes]
MPQLSGGGPNHYEKSSNYAEQDSSYHDKCALEFGPKISALKLKDREKEFKDEVKEETSLANLDAEKRPEKD